MSERPETEADLGTFPDGDRGFSGVSSWCGIRRDAPLRNDGLVPVLLLRRRIRRRLEIIPSVRDTGMCEHGVSLMQVLKAVSAMSFTFLIGRDGNTRRGV